MGNFSYVKNHLRLGDLQGNRFTLTLRNVTAERDAVDTSLASLRDNGFINYFGLQRFGSGIVSTADVGLALIR